MKERYTRKFIDNFFSYSVDLFCVADTNGRFTRLNPEWEKTLGYSLPELEGKKFIEFVHPDDVEETINATGTLANNEPVLNFINRYRHKDGSYRWIEWRSFSSDGNIYATARDVTERVKIEQDLKKREEQLSSLAQNIPGIVYQFYARSNGETGLYYVSDHSIKYLGLDNRELDTYFRRFTACIPEEERDQFLATIKYAIDNHSKWDYSGRFIRPDGAAIYIHAFSQPRTIMEEIIFDGLILDISENKQADEKFRQLADLNQTILDTITLGIVHVRKGKIEWVNRAFCKLTGKSIEESTGIDAALVYGFDADREKVEKEAKESFSRGESYTTNIQVKRQDGSLLWVNLIGKSLDPADPTAGSIWLLNDISEQKESERILAEERRMLWATVNNVSDFVYVKDTESRFVIVNKAVADIFDMKPEELIGKTDKELFPDYLSRDFYKDERELVNTGKPIIKKEERLTDTRGNPVVVVTTKLPLYDMEGVMMGFVGTGHIVTEYKKMEEALQKRVLALTRPLDSPEAIRFTDLFNVEEIQVIQDTFANAVGLASVITHPDGTPITRPSNYSRLCELIRSTPTGLTNCLKSDSFLGQQSASGPIVQPCLSGQLWDAGTSIRVGGKHVANWLIGQIRTESSNIEEMVDYAGLLGLGKEEYRKALLEVPVMSEDQFRKVAGSLYILANELSIKAYQNIQQARFITEQKRAEEEIKKLNIELERRVDERTRELNEAVKDLESFAYSVSHDLRAPIRHIDGFIKLMLSCIPQPSETIINYYNRVSISTQRMSSMIDSLLSFSRLGRKNLTISVVDLNSLVREIMEQFKPDIGSRNINWKIARLPLVQCDKNLIKLALENLISNSIKYTSKNDEAVIEIGCTDNNDSDKHEIFIRDNGIGFDMEYAGKLFGVFQRLHKTDDFEGIGIGLANVKQIIEKHNGTVRAEGKAGEGAVFFITFPKKPIAWINS